MTEGNKESQSRRDVELQRHAHRLYLELWNAANKIPITYRLASVIVVSRMLSETLSADTSEG